MPKLRLGTQAGKLRFPARVVKATILHVAKREAELPYARAQAELGHENHGDFMRTFDHSHILVVGGAGFVGSNLVRELITASSAHVLVVDNLLSAERINVPPSKQVDFLEGSVTHDSVLAQLPRNLDYVFHLATYHGNQNSMADPLADHENNTYTTLKLYEHLKSFKQLKKVVYSSAGCTVAEKTYGAAKATTEEDPVSLWLDTPYQMSKIFGEFYSNYYFKAHRPARRQGTLSERLRPRRNPRAGEWRGTTATVWRNVIPTFVYRAIKQMPLRIENGGVASRDFIFFSRHRPRPDALRAFGDAGEAYNLASGDETSILDLANRINLYAGSKTPLELAPMRAWDRSGKRFGPRKSEGENPVRRGSELERRLADHRRMDESEFAINRKVHRETSAADGGGGVTVSVYALASMLHGYRAPGTWASVNGIHRAPAIDRQANPRHEIVVDQKQHRLGNVLRRSLSFHQSCLNDVLLFLIRQVRREHHRPRHDAINTHVRIARAEFDGQGSRHGRDRALGDEIGGIIEIRAFGRPFAERDDAAAFLLFDHCQAGVLRTQKRAERVDLEKITQVGGGQVFQFFVAPVSSAIDEHVEAAEVGQRFADHGPHRFFVPQFRLNGNGGNAAVAKIRDGLVGLRLRVPIMHHHGIAAQPGRRRRVGRRGACRCR